MNKYFEDGDNYILSQGSTSYDNGFDDCDHNTYWKGMKWILKIEK